MQTTEPKTYAPIPNPEPAPTVTEPLPVAWQPAPAEFPSDDAPAFAAPQVDEDDENSAANEFMASLTWLPHVRAAQTSASPVAANAASAPVPLPLPLSSGATSPALQASAKVRRNRIVLAGIVALVTSVGGISKASQLVAKPAPLPYPKTWDARVVPMVKFIEKETGAPFKHPITIQFVDKAAFNSLWVLNAPFDGKFDKSEQKQNKFIQCVDGRSSSRGQCAPFLRIVEPSINTMYLRFLGANLGFDGVSPYARIGVDPSSVAAAGRSLKMEKSDILGFYDRRTITVYVRGKNLDGVQQTVAHELTHAWQDQHGLLHPVEPGLDTTYLHLAMTEGHAELIGNRWLDSLSKTQKDVVAANDAAYASEWNAQEDARPQGQSVDPATPSPRMLELALSSWPYVAGPKYFASKSATEVRHLLEHPPRSTWSVLEPETNDTGRGVHVANPKVNGPHYTRSNFSIGPLMWTLGLSVGVGLDHARIFRRAWTGDSAILYQQASGPRNVCLADRIKFVSNAGRTQALGILNMWASVHPLRATGVSVEPLGVDEIVVTSCG